MLIMILGIILAVLSIAGLVVFFMVLIKLFKNEGILKGILGLICSIYPFIWGWLKHKELKLTKLMTIWTATIVLGLALQIYMATAGMFDLMKGFQPDKMPKPPPPRAVQRPVRKAPKRIAPKPSTRKPDKKPGVKVASKPAAPLKISPGKIPAPKEKIDFEAEIKKVNDMIEKNDTNADAFYNRGWLYAYNGDRQSAEKDYSRAIQLKKGYQNAYYNRGLLFIQGGRFDLAVKDFSEVIKLNPSASDAYCNRGNANYKLGRIELAIQDFDAAIEANPKDGDLYYNRAVAYDAKGEKSKARADFKKAAQLGNRDAKNYLKTSPGKPGTPKTPINPAGGKE